MNEANTIGLIIITMVALIMVSIGVVQMRKRDIPVGFYNMIDPPKKEEITDLISWNKKHGMIWVIYGICIELGFFIGLGMPSEAWQMVFMMGGVIVPLPLMVLRHRSLEKIYQVRN